MNRRAYRALIGPISAMLLLFFLYSVAEILLLLFLAILLSLYLAALTDVFQRALRLPRRLGLAGALLVTLFVLAGSAWLIVPPVTSQLQEVWQSLPAQLALWDEQLLHLAGRSPLAAQLFGSLPEGQSYVGSILQEIAGYFRGLGAYVFGGVRLVVEVISVLAMGLYLAFRPALYREGVIALVPPLHRELARYVLSDLATALRGWIIGQLLMMSSLGLLTWIGLEALDVPYALAFGVFTGLVAIVPFFGTLSSTLLPALFVLGSAGPLKVLAVILLGIVVHLLETNLIAPMIMERQVHLPPALTILSVLIMAHLLGLVGVLVAVPMLASVLVILRRLYVHRVLEGKGFRRAVRDRLVELRLPEDGVLVHPAAREMTLPALLERRLP
jgi:predicted PurR-regulated permease PerM